MRYASGEAKPRQQDRAVAARAKRIYDDIQTADFEARGILALIGDIMEGTAHLDDLRENVAKDRPGLNAILAQLELDGVQQVREIIAQARPRTPKRLSW